MKTKILNTWTSKKEKLNFFEVENIVFEIGEFKIYKDYSCYLYTFKNLAINQLVGLNKEHLIRLHDNKEPLNSQDNFLFNRAKENLKKALELIN